MHEVVDAGADEEQAEQREPRRARPGRDRELTSSPVRSPVRRRRASRSSVEATCAKQCSHRISERPVISAGWGMPSSCEHGRAPRRRGCPHRCSSRTPCSVTISGTGFSEWAVLGRAVGLEHVVGVAVVGGDHAGAAARRAPPRRPRARHASTVSTALHRRGDHAGVADHVGVGEVDDRRTAGASSRQAATNASAASRALISRLVVVGRHVARRGHQLAPLARAAAPPRRR